MLVIPLYTLLIVYAIFLLVFFTFFIINFWHIFLTGTTNFNSFVVTLLVIILTVLTFYGTWYFLRGTDWQQPLFTLNLSNFSNLFQPGGNNNEFLNF